MAICNPTHPDELVHEMIEGIHEETGENYPSGK